MKYILFDWKKFLKKEKLTIKKVSHETSIDSIELKLLSKIGNGVVNIDVLKVLENVYGPDIILEYLDPIVGRDE
jgi:hypothetical protein